MQTLVVMALKVESQGLFEADGYSPLYCGVGAVKATYHLTKRIHDHKPQRVINLGTAGSHVYKKGDLVECISFIQRRPHDFMRTNTEILSSKAITELPPAVCGSADFVESTRPLTECDIFDMEAYALAYVCKKMNVGFHSFKYVTDSSNENLIQDWQTQLLQSAETLLGQLRKM